MNTKLLYASLCICLLSLAQTVHPVKIWEIQEEEGIERLPEEQTLQVHTLPIEETGEEQETQEIAPYKPKTKRPQRRYGSLPVRSSSIIPLRETTK